MQYHDIHICSILDACIVCGIYTCYVAYMHCLWHACLVCGIHVLDVTCMYGMWHVYMACGIHARYGWELNFPIKWGRVNKNDHQLRKYLTSWEYVMQDSYWNFKVSVKGIICIKSITVKSLLKFSAFAFSMIGSFFDSGFLLFQVIIINITYQQCDPENTVSYVYSFSFNKQCLQEQLESKVEELNRRITQYQERLEELVEEKDTIYVCNQRLLVTYDW